MKQIESPTWSDKDMDTKYFIGEIDLPNGIRKDLIVAKDINNAHDIIEHKIKIKQLDYDSITDIRTTSIYAPFRPIGSFLVRSATTTEILEDQLKDFAGGWDEYNIQGFAEDIIETVLETLPKEVLIEELERRKEEEDYY